MITYKEIIVDAITGEEVIKPYSAEQVAEAEAGAIEAAKRTEAQAKAEADKASATAKLEALGLTTDDLKALGL